MSDETCGTCRWRAWHEETLSYRCELRGSGTRRRVTYGDEACRLWNGDEEDLDEMRARVMERSSMLGQCIIPDDGRGIGDFVLQLRRAMRAAGIPTGEDDRWRR